MWLTGRKLMDSAKMKACTSTKKSLKIFERSRSFTVTARQRTTIQSVRHKAQRKLRIVIVVGKDSRGAGSFTGHRPRKGGDSLWPKWPEK